MNPVGAKISGAKTPATNLSARKEKSRKEYVPEDPDSDPNFSNSSLSDSVPSAGSNYKRRRLDKRNKNRKCNKQDPIKLCAKLTVKLLKTAYKSKVLKFKLGEDPLQIRVSFLTFIESLEIIFHDTRKLVRYL